MNKSICIHGGKGRAIAGDNGWVTPVVTIAALGGVGYLLYTFLKGSVPGAGTAANNAAITTTAAAAAAQSLAAANAAGIQTSLPDATLAGFATSLVNLITVQDTFPVDANTATQIQNIVTQCNTSADWYKLVSDFGTKQYNAGGNNSLCNWFAINCQTADLPSLLRIALPASNLSTINSYFADTFDDASISI
jgi:hypothetical protein